MKKGLSKRTAVQIYNWVGNHWPLLLILAIGLFLRLYRLSSVPVGINGDELFNAIDAMQIGNGRWPLFFEGNQGREALFLYLVAASMRLLGQTIFAFRLPAVILGTGAVWLGYWLGRDLFNRRVGLLAGALTAVSLWPVMESRWSLRAVSLTFFTALTIYLLNRAIQSGRRPYWWAGGAALGLTLYTYIPARLFPLVVLAWFGWLFWRQRELARSRWRPILLSLLIALLVFAPFGRYMMQYPDKVNQRVGNLSSAWDKALKGQPEALVEPVTAVLYMFTIEGDHEWRYHVSGDPIFDPITGLFFYAGTAICLWRALARRSKMGDATAPSYALLLLWAGAMLAPDAVLDSNASFLRAAGAIIPIYLITAVGLDTIYQALIKKWPVVGQRPYLPSLVTLGFLIILANTRRSYFNIWNNNPEVRDIYQADIAQMGLFLRDATIPAGQRIFIAHPYAYDAAPRMLSYYTNQPASWFVPGGGFVWPDQGDGWYLVPADESLAAAHLPPDVLATAVTNITFDDGETAFRLYKLSGSQVNREPQHTFAVEFVNGPTLIGYDLPDALNRGETIPLTLHWQIPADHSFLPTQLTYAQVRLVDDRGRVWGQNGQLIAYPQAGWQSDDRFSQQIALDIPAGLPPGPIYFRFDLSDNEGQLVEFAGAGDGNRAGPFLVRSQPLTNFTLKPDQLLFDNTLVVRDVILSTLTEPGLPVDIALDWVALSQPALDYRAQFQLFAPGAAEPIVTQISAILPEIYPPSQWQPWEQVRSLHRLAVPVAIPAGVDTLELRLQLLPPGKDEPAPITQGDNQLAAITLNLRQHLFTIPSISHALTAQFGPAIQLLGYDMQMNDNEIDLILYWQALAAPARNYTVFNHLIGADGQLYGQLDSPPVSDAWLTSAWLPGEVVIDRRLIAVDKGVGNGRYTLAIGLYTNEEGRLPVTVDGQPQANDQLSLTEISIER